MPHVKSGRLRALAITSISRSPALPELPTVAESGLPGFEVGQWYGVLAPAGTPDTVVARLNSELVKVMQTPEVNEWLLREGSLPVGNTPREFAAYLKDDVAK